MDDTGDVRERHKPEGTFGKWMLQVTQLPGDRLAVTFLDSRNIMVFPNSPLQHISNRLWGRTPRTPPASHQPSPALPEWLETVVSGGGASGADGSSTVKITAADGSRSFWVHRSALNKHSDYFKRLLKPNGGFGDSGAAEVSLPDGADPEAFKWLLSYMYGGELLMPDALLRPAAELAGWLLLPAKCTHELHRRLMAAVTPGSVLSDLIWAERHGLTELVPQLKAYLLRHRLEVVEASAGEEEMAGLLRKLMALNPDLAAELVSKLVMSPAV